jgi:hypothetical protein
MKKYWTANEVKMLDDITKLPALSRNLKLDIAAAALWRSGLQVRAKAVQLDMYYRNGECL